VERHSKAANKNFKQSAGIHKLQNVRFHGYFVLGLTSHEQDLDQPRVLIQNPGARRCRTVVVNRQPYDHCQYQHWQRCSMRHCLRRRHYWIGYEGWASTNIQMVNYKMNQ
jgi:hypothetical protein